VLLGEGLPRGGLNAGDHADASGLGHWLDLGIPSCGEAAEAVLNTLNPVRYYEDEINAYENGCSTGDRWSTASKGPSLVPLT